MDDSAATPIPIFDALNDDHQGHLKAIAEARYSEDQVCRVCVRATKRSSADVFAIARVRRDGGDVAAFLDAHRCAPDRFEATWRLDTASCLTRIQPDGSTPVTIGRKPSKPAEPVALVTNCGQQLAEKCRTCGNLVAQTQKVPGGTNASGRTWFRDVVVGGHCRLENRCEPVRMPTDTTKSKSCSLCANLTFYTNDSCQTHGDPVKIDLTPYERWQLTSTITDNTAGLAIWQARRHVGQRQLRNGAWITTGTSRIYVGRRIPFTEEFPEPAPRRQRRIRWVNAQAKRVRHEEIVEIPAAVRVAFRTGMGEVAHVFSTTNDDPRVGIVEHIGDTSVAISFLTPYQRDFGLSENNFRRPLYPPASTECRCVRDTSWWSSAQRPQWATQAHDHVRSTGKGIPNPRCGDCGGTGAVAGLPARQPVGVRFGHAPDTDCPRCRPDKACYYHAKGFSPVVGDDGTRTYGRSVADEVHAELFSGVTPGMTRGNWREDNRSRMLAHLRDHTGEANPARHLRVDPSTGIVTDRDHNAPNTLWFILRLRDLTEAYPRWARAIRRQADAAQIADWRRSERSHEINPAFAKPLGVQPWAPYCSAYLADPTIGLDLRAELGDWWGDPRSNQGTNPSMHYTKDNYFSRTRHAALEEFLRVTSPGERLAEHMASTRRWIAHMAPAVARTEVDWDSFVPTSVQVYDPQGRESFHPDYDPSTQAYIDWLDEPVTITIANDADGETFTGSRRWERYGYTNYRGGRQLRRNDVAEVWAQRAAEELISDAEFDPEAIYVGFVCLACGATPSVEEALDADLVCGAPNRNADARCAGALAWYEGRGEDAGTDMGASQIGPDEISMPRPRRSINPDMVLPPDTARWQQTEILMSLGHDCPHWRPQGPRGWSMPAVPRRGPVNMGTWVGRTFRLYVPGGHHTIEEKAFHDRGDWRHCPSCVHDVEITEDNLDEPLINTLVRTNAKATVVYTDRNGHPQLASVLEERLTQEES